MFEKFGQMAERAATSVSRRQFLGRFGRGAVAVAAAIGGLLAFPAASYGERYICPDGSFWTCVGSPVGTFCGPHSTCQRIKGTDVCGCECKGKGCP